MHHSVYYKLLAGLIFANICNRLLKHEPQANVFYISRVFSHVRLRLLHLLYGIQYILHAQNNKTPFYVLYSDKTYVLDQSERAGSYQYY